MLPETVVEIEAAVVASSQAPTGVELHGPVITVLGEPAEAPPFEMRRPELNATLPSLLDHAAVSLRHPRIRAAFAISAASVAGFRSTLDALRFTEIQTPKIVGAATESGANVFALDYFGRPAFLAQSPQLYKQMMVGVFERVYETGPVFRAEPHDTTRHLAEYVSLDVELGFIDDHRDVEAVLREVLAGMVSAISERAAAAVALLGLDLPRVPGEIPRIHFHDAQVMLEAALGESVVGEPDLAPAHERWLGDLGARAARLRLLVRRGLPDGEAAVLHEAPTRSARASPTASTCSSGASSSSPAGSACIGTRSTRRWWTRRHETRSTATSRRSGTACLPTAASRSGWNAGRRGVVGVPNVRQVTMFPRDRDRLTP